MTEQLKPCPFCGRQPKRVSTSFSERFAYAQEVSYVCSCGCRRSARGDTSKGGYADNSKVEENALAAWNTRALTTSQPAQAGEVLKCAMRHTPVWKSGVSGLPYQESNFACETCGYVGKHDMHPGCKKETQLAAQATPSSANRTLCDYFLNPNLSPVLSFDDDKQATPPQQAAGEPVGEHVATVAEVHMSRYTLEWNGSPLPEGTKLYTRPAPGVPEAWDEGYKQGVEDERTSEANIGVAGFGAKVAPARQNPYRAAQAKGGEA